MSASERHDDGHRVDVLVLDGHEASRVGLGLLLGRAPWVGARLLAADREQAVGLVARRRPDVAVVDVSDAGPFVASLVGALRAPHPALRVLLVARCAAVSPVPLGGVRARRLPPGASSREVLAAVLEVARESGRPPRDEPPKGPLTARERQILALLATGATNREIAAQLHVGPDSVKKHASSIYRKLGVRNRTEATQLLSARTA